MWGRGIEEALSQPGTTSKATGVRGQAWSCGWHSPQVDN